MKTTFHRFTSLALAGAVAGPLLASSHREAPLITTTPKVDGTDFYMFSSYEPGRENYVTFVANYIPLQDAYGGPNFFQLDPNALYEIHVDNSGDAVEDLTFQFRFQNTLRNVALVVGAAGNLRTNAVPVLAVGPITAGNNAALNVDQTYTITLIKGPRRTGAATTIANAADGSTTFTKPQDYVGDKTFPDYNGYANQYMYNLTLPGTTNLGRVFVGQRKDPFVVNLGETFDLVNITPSPLGPEDAGVDTLSDKNVTAICLELPKDFLRGGPTKPVIGGWTTASMIGSGQTNQVSRLGMPLVNEVVIGVKDKDKFNASEPKDDVANFVDYVTHPTLPAIIELLYGAAGVKAPTLFPRADLVAVFATGVTGLNADGGVGEMVRLNMDVPATPRDQQKNMGVAAGYSKGVLTATNADLAGFPNGRRPGDDVVDIALRVVMGKLLTPDVAPSGDLPFTDGATVNSSMFLNAFPYLLPPLKGSPNDPTISFVPQTSGGAGGAYKPVQGTFDPATQTLTVPKPAGDTGFLRLQSDRKTTLSNPTVTADSISAKVQ